MVPADGAGERPDPGRGLSPALRVSRSLVVVNPASAGGRTLRRWPGIERALSRAGIDHTAQLTLGPGDATTLTREAILSRGIRRVVAVGGDGTLNEVVNGCFDGGCTPLADGLTVGLIPSGTGGDFRHALGLPSDPEAAARLLAGGSTRVVDIGRVSFADGSVRHFINIADCGIGGEVASRVNRRRHRGGGLVGTAVFLGVSVATMLTFRGRDLLLSFDGETIHRKVQQVVVANGTHFGGGMRMAPDAKPDDGLFDVIIVADISRLGSIRAVPRLYRGTHLALPVVEVRRARSIDIAAAPGEKPTLFDVDGEQVGRVPAQITICPGALRFASPP